MTKAKNLVQSCHSYESFSAWDDIGLQCKGRLSIFSGHMVQSYFGWRTTLRMMRFLHTIMLLGVLPPQGGCY